MTRPKLEKLLKGLALEIKKALDIAAKTKKSAQEIAKAAASSPSQSGDREHSKNQAEIAEDFLKELKTANKQILEAAELEAPSMVDDTCFLKLSFEDSRIEDYFILKNPVKLEGIKLISEGSALGQALLGKKVGDKFEITEPRVLGVILEIG